MSGDLKNPSTSGSQDSPRFRCLEFFCGIGGFHIALKRICKRIDVVGAFDINTTTNAIYSYNFPTTELHQRNIQSLSAKFLDEKNADIWTLSPPCQPFVKKGLQLDLGDARCDALKCICDRIRVLNKPPRFIMVENVVGFRDSDAEQMLLEALEARSYHHEWYEINPLDYGIPNSRPRYYLLAKLTPDAVLSGKYLERWGSQFPQQIKDILCTDAAESEELLISVDTILKHRDVIDLVEPRSFRSSCFTKSYGTYIKGTGSYLVSNVPASHETLEFEKAHFLQIAAGEDKLEAVQRLGIRAFSVPEMCSLMGFEKDLRQPPNIMQHQMYKALGNSVNIFVVCHMLTRLLFEDWKAVGSLIAA